MYFPEIGRFAGNNRSDWFLALIERFPTLGSIIALEREAFVAEAWPLVGRKVSKARLINDIYETACSSIALPVQEENAAITMFRMIIAQARGLIRERNRIEEIAQVTLANHHDYQLLRRIPGIGPTNALTILAEAGALRRFGHHRQFLKFCGLGPRHLPTRYLPRSDQAVEVRQCPDAPNVLDGGAGRRASMRQQLPRQARPLLPVTRTMPIAVARR